MDEILEKGWTTNGSHRRIYTLTALDDSDLVRAYDLCTDYSALIDQDEYGHSIAGLILSRAGLSEPDDDDMYFAAVDEAVEILRESANE